MAEITLVGGVSCDTFASAAHGNTSLSGTMGLKRGRTAKASLVTESHLKPPEEDAEGSEVEVPAEQHKASVASVS